MRVATSILLIACAAAPATAAQDVSGAFVVRLGNDTVAIETYTRSPTELRGELVVRTPRSVHRIYAAELAPDGSIRRFELVTHNISGGPGPAETRVTYELQGDTAVMQVPRGDGTVTVRAPGAAGATPFAIWVFGLVEDLARRAAAAGGDSVVLRAVNVGASQPSPVRVKRSAPNEYTMMIGGLGPWTAKLDESGRLVTLSGHGSTLQIEVERVASLDMAALGPTFATRSLGSLSSRDTVRAAVGGAELLVDYGRPLKRGRVIFGQVVPWGEVWRTGANAATQFHTTADLVVGGAAVPAGQYTLWTIPTPSGWTLVLNGKTKDERGNPLWGTLYDATADAVRIPLTVESLGAPVEQFTITLEPQGAGAVLRMAWDQTRVSVPVARK